MTTVKKETRKGRNSDDCLVFVFEELGEKEVSLFLDNEIKRIKKDMISFSEGFEDPIIVDFSNVRFVSVLFLGILLILRNQNKKIFLCGLSSSLKELFTMTRLNKLFSILESVEDALEKN